MRFVKELRVFALTLILAIALPNYSNAHRMDSAMSIINIAADGNVEITHRLFAHDIEHQFELSNIGMDYFETPQGQQQVETYLREVFVFSDAQNHSFDLTFVGAQIDGDLLYVYFESKIGAARELMIDSNILNQFSSAQTNFVNIHRGDLTKSLAFSGGQGAIRVTIP
jgi:hypothetical protein